MASARVEIGPRVTGEIAAGLLLFVCAEPDDNSALAERLIPLYEELVAIARKRHAPVARGEFGAAMRVHLVGERPVTIPITVR